MLASMCGVELCKINTHANIAHVDLSPAACWLCSLFVLLPVKSSTLEFISTETILDPSSPSSSLIDTQTVTIKSLMEKIQETALLTSMATGPTTSFPPAPSSSLPGNLNLRVIPSL